MKVTLHKRHSRSRHIRLRKLFEDDILRPYCFSRSFSPYILTRPQSPTDTQTKQEIISISSTEWMGFAGELAGLKQPVCQTVCTWCVEKQEGLGAAVLEQRNSESPIKAPSPYHSALLCTGRPWLSLQLILRALCEQLLSFLLFPILGFL